MKIINKVCKLWKKLDHFGVQMQFRIADKKEQKSLSGGLATSVYFVFSLVFIIYSVIPFLTRGNVNLIFTNKVVNSNPLVNLTNSGFAIGIGIIYSLDAANAMIDADFFDYSFTITSWVGLDEFFREKVPLRPCQLNDFPSINEDLLILNEVTKMLCPEITGKNFTLGGLYTDYWYQYLELSVNLKPEYLENTSVVENFTNYNPISANIAFIDTGIIYDDLENPTPSMLNYFYTAIDVESVKQFEFDISNIAFTSDENLFFSSPYTIYDTGLDSTRENVIKAKDRKHLDDTINKTVITFIMRSSAKYLIVNRNYQKFSDYLASISGLLSQILFLLFMIFTYRNRKGAEQKVMNKCLLFDTNKNNEVDYLIDLHSKIVLEEKSEKSENFEKSEKLSNIKFNEDFSDNKNNSKIIYSANKIRYNFSPLSKNFNQTHKENCDNDIKDFPGIKRVACNNYFQVERSTPFNRSYEDLNKNESKLIPNIQKIKKTNVKADINRLASKARESLMFYPKSLKLNNRPKRVFQLNIWQIFFGKFCCTEKCIERNKIIRHAEKKIYYYLDIITYIKKMQEVDILKYLLLSGDQLKLFNFLSKPPISLNDVTSQIYKDFMEEQRKYVYFNKTEVDKICSAYKNVRSKIKMGEKDRKLVDLFDAEMESVRNLN